ncbi:MAG: WYL domain-containing protein [Gemmatimonadetes bacterium]|nr:WYL domain-containing protein [Gemmatimonadota bacterium]
MPTQPKLQRWTDLLAALLRRHGAVDFEALRGEVGAYAAHTGQRSALMRMFERDKDELRALGVPIETVAGEDNNSSLYRLASRHFYLPFLQLAYERTRGPGRPPARPRGPGYQSLPVLAFEPDELDAVARAARRVTALGDAALAHEATTALRKLAHDLPMVLEPAGDDDRVLTERAPDHALLSVLGDALERRKSVRFTYRSMHRDETAARAADPWGLAFLGGHWYLVARDHEADALRQFRVSRIAAPAANTVRPQSPDFAIPDDFDLAAHAASRHAWELGDAEQREVLVRFTVRNGVTVSAMRLGDAVPEDATVRRFRVRRPDTFALWVLGFAGAAEVESPPELREQVRALARAALGAYDGGPRR